MTGPPDQGAPRRWGFEGLVAVVDDDQSVRRALQRLLSSLGVRCVTHHSGVEFLASPAVHEVDCVLLDVHMPHLSGVELLDEVRVAASKLPIVLMTGRYDVDFAERALRTGVSGFLRKPFTEDELIEAVSLAAGRVAS